MVHLTHNGESPLSRLAEPSCWRDGSISTTAVYGHWTPAMADHLAARMDAVLGGWRDDEL